MNILSILDILEAKLSHHAKELDLTICGGAAIHLLGYSNRPTKDIDVIVPIIPESLDTLIQEVATEHHLANDWLNNGPQALIHDLEHGWEQRTLLLYEEGNLRIRVLARQDLIFTKLYAMCDRREDIQDLLSMKVTEEELKKAGDLVKSKDGHPDWPTWVDVCIAEVLQQGDDDDRR
jgi:hypothetical protein